MTSYTIPQLQELLTKQYEALKTNETLREELIVDMKSEIKSLHKKLDLQMGSNNPLNLKDKGFGFHSSGSPRSKPYHELLSDSFKKLKEDNEKLKKANDTFTLGAKRTIESNCKLYKENEKLTKDNKKLKRANEINAELWDTSEKCVGELEEEIKKLKEDKFNYNVFVKEKKNMVILMEKQKEEIEALKKEEEFDYGESDDWAWGYGSVQKDNEYVIHISGGGDGVSPNGFEDWVIKKNSPNELEYFIRHGGDIPDKLQHGKILITCPEGNYVSFVPDGAEHRDGETDFEWLLDEEDFLCYEEEEE